MGLVPLILMNAEHAGGLAVEVQFDASVLKRDRGSGIEITTVTRIFSLPHTRLSITEFEQLVNYLFREFRPFIAEPTSDEQIRNQLRFELLEFQDCAKTSSTNTCPLPSGGKFSIHDLQ